MVIKQPPPSAHRNVMTSACGKGSDDVSVGLGTLISDSNMSQRLGSVDARKVRSGRITELDALRGVAATSVLYFHIGAAAGLSTPGVLGQYGVSLFFIISGFVITMTTSKGGIQEFIASRIARLFPTYWCAIIVTSIFAFLLEKHAVPFRTIIINIPMVQSLLKAGDVDGTYWTLAVEMQFYIVMAILLWLGLIRRVDAACFFCC